MNFKPILFSTPMVRAILEDRKTMTRRMTGLDKLNEKPDNWKQVTPDVYTICNEEDLDPWSYCDFQTLSGEYMACVRFPYGQVGDVLWVRETFCPWHNKSGYFYAADQKYPDFKGGQVGRPIDYDERGEKWKPSIHMPKAACRIFLEITDIRVERLQDITEADAMAEGIMQVTKDGKLLKYCVYDHRDYSSTPWQDMPTKAVAAFDNLWVQINGQESLEANPWVWVVSFKRINKPSSF